MTSLADLHGRRAAGRNNGAVLRAGAAAAALAVCAAAGTAGIGGGAAQATLAAVVAFAGVAIGHPLGHRDNAAAKANRRLMLRVADELSQYRAFTQLLRDQGTRIAESSGAAALAIVAGLTEMDAALGRLRTVADRAGTDEAAELRSLIEAIGAPVVNMLGQVQFQDMTQQQIAFLSRLSLMLDDHMVQLAGHLVDSRAHERIDRFRKMFEEALDDCVMDGQRDDHHAASGLALREDTGCKLELF
jgi:hypothetical protein